jgi:ADP-heptose:LPS heptosyltransferase
MFPHLQIRNSRERLLVGLADAAIAPVGWRRRPAAAPIRRILLLRLERIGDLLMTLDAIGRVRHLAPDAGIDLVVGSWNADLARLIPRLQQVDLVDVPWLAREGTGWSWPALFSEARGWRRRRYDLVLNFEPDIRSNFLAWLSGAPRRLGYGSAGGGAFLTTSLVYDPARHVRDNAIALVDRALQADSGAGETARREPLVLPDAVRAHAAARLPADARRLIGIHASGGRPSKQWHLDRFADVARTLARRYDATVVLTGSAADRGQVDEVRSRLDDVPVVDLAGDLDLPTLAGVLARLDVLITGDTGPMHLAAAVETPVVALFGPSDPARYGPGTPAARVIRVDLWCSPCGMVRLPPVRCRNRVPECLDGISVDLVVRAAVELLDAGGPHRRPGPV